MNGRKSPNPSVQSLSHHRGVWIWNYFIVKMTPFLGPNSFTSCRQTGGELHSLSTDQVCAQKVTNIYQNTDKHLPGPGWQVSLEEEPHCRTVGQNDSGTDLAGTPQNQHLNPAKGSSDIALDTPTTWPTTRSWGKISISNSIRTGNNAWGSKALWQGVRLAILGTGQKQGS